MSMQIIKGEDSFYTSVAKALSEIDPNWESYNGLLIVGTHSPDKLMLEDVLERIRNARLADVPVLGLCMGMQLMAIEYARNVMNIPDATSEEIGPGTHVIEKLPELRVGIKPVGGRMESHWHNFGMKYDWAQEFKDFDIVFGGDCVEEMRLRPLLFYKGVQYHPEYQSSAKHPHPLLVDFLNKCKSE